MSVARSDVGKNTPTKVQSIWDRLSSQEPGATVQKPSQTPSTFSTEEWLGCNFVFGASPTNPIKFTSPITPRRSITPTASKANVRTSVQSPGLVKSIKTPLSTSSTRGHKVIDPDLPIPSVERETPFTRRSPRESLSSTRSNTPASRDSIYMTPAPQGGEISSDDLGRLQNLTLQSPRPQTSAPSRSMPSIHVTSSVTDTSASRSRVERSDSLINELRTLNLDAGNGSTRGPSIMPDELPFAPRSPSLSSTGSESIYKVEDEMTTGTLSNLSEAYLAFEKARALTKKLAKNLSASELSLDRGSSIAKLCEQARDLAHFELPSSRTVGVVGDAGVGKSSLINSLLDYQGIAPEGSRGTACTRTVTEFVFHDRDDFVVEVEFFSKAELERHFEELLRSYREAHEPQDASDSPSDSSDKVDLQRRVNLAKEIFQVSFEDKLGDIDSMLSSVSIQVAAQRMVNWTEHLIPSQKVQNTYPTMGSCAARLADLGRDLASRRCVPFIRTSRVFLKAFILSQGLVLADLPGLRDISPIRQAITERYMLNCHQIFVVADMVRPLTNSSIREVFGLAHRIKLSNIDIICTKSDEISQSTTFTDWPEKKRELEDLRAKCETRGRNLKKIEDHMETLIANLGESFKLGNRTLELHQDLIDCAKSKRELEILFKSAEFDERYYITTTRNQDVAEGLRRDYKSKGIGPDPNVFCVSPRMYSKERNKPISEAMPFIKLSNIPKLRQYCITIVAQSRIQAIKQFIEHKLPALINSIQIWVETGSDNRNTEKKQSTLQAVSSIQQELDALSSSESMFSQLPKNLRVKFQRYVDRPLKEGEMRWSNEASKVSRTWIGLYYQTAQACCNRYGLEFKSGERVHFWNEEATSKMNADMLLAWDKLTSITMKECEKIQAATKELFQGMLEDASKHGLHTLAKTIEHNESLLTKDLEQDINQLKQSLLSLYRVAFGSIEDGLIFELMKPTYEKALQDTGSGCRARRIKLIVSRFGSEQLFIEHRCELRNRFRKLTETFQSRIENDLKTHCSSIKQDLDMRRNENVILESERHPRLRRGLQRAVLKAKDELATIGQAVERSA